MEHLPQRAGQTKSMFPAIPYLCQHEYDEGPFLDYPQRLGLPRLVNTADFRLDPTLSIANKQALKSMSPAELQAFLQNWLFFGLLHELLGDLYRYEDYRITPLDNEIQKTIITTANLVSRLDEWEVEVKQDMSSLRDVYEHLAACINLAYASLVVEYPAFDHDLKFHLTSVLELLAYAVSKACNLAWIDDPRRTSMHMPWANIISEDFRRTVLLERSNCCPSQMQMLIQDFLSPQALSFVAACFDEDEPNKHKFSCDEYACRIGSRQIPFCDGYTCRLGKRQMPYHVSDSCECRFLRVDEDQLIECLEKGSLPLLRIKCEADAENISVEVVASTDSTSYVALSHVWADGLGNSEATALPRCQLLRLKALIDDLDYFEDTDESNPSDHTKDKPEMLLWCDSLCCPVVSLEGKNMALRQIYRTYDEAEVVLVLEQSLVSNRIGGMRPDEACVRIATSRWMTRLWTLQEGALPARKGKLWFQFTKTALPATTLYNYIKNISKTDIRRRGIAESMIGRFNKFTHLFDVENIENRTARLENIMRGLMYRSVTVPSDEPLIIATLLALGLDRILASDSSERMNVLWRLIGTSPAGVDRDILFHRGPKLKQRGLHWAPQSLLSKDYPFAIPMLGDKDNPGFLDEYSNPKGLVVELAGFRVSIAKPAQGVPKHLAGFDSLPRDSINKHNLLSRDGEGRWYLLRPGQSNILESPPALEAMCAVLSRLTNPWVLYRGSSSNIPANMQAHLGLLVEEADEQQAHSNQFKYVKTKSHVIFGHLTRDLNQICEAAYCLTQELASSAAGRRLEDLAAALTDEDSPSYREALEDVDRESDRLAESPFAIEALTASGCSADRHGRIRIIEYMERIWRGLYLHVEDFVPCNRKWCVD